MLHTIVTALLGLFLLLTAVPNAKRFKSAGVGAVFIVGALIEIYAWQQGSWRLTIIGVLVAFLGSSIPMHFSMLHAMNDYSLRSILQPFRPLPWQAGLIWWILSSEWMWFGIGVIGSVGLYLMIPNKSEQGVGGQPANPPQVEN